MSYYDHLGLPEKVLRWLGNPYNAANTAAGFNAGVLAINVLTRRFFGSANGVNIVASAAGIGISVLSARQSHYWWKQASADLKRLNESASKDNLWKAEHDRAALDGAAGYHNARLSTLAAGALLTGICSVPKLSVDSKGVVPRGLSAAAFLATAAGAGLYYARERKPDWVRWLASSNPGPELKSTQADERKMALRRGGASGDFPSGSRTQAEQGPASRWLTLANTTPRVAV